MDPKNGASDLAQARADARTPENKAMPRLTDYGNSVLESLPPERVDDTCLLLMQRAAEFKRQLAAQGAAFDQLVNSVVAERARLSEGDSVDEQGNIVRARKPEPAPVA